MNPPFTITQRECRLISDLVHERFGIVLGDKKRALIAGRLQKVLRREGFGSFEEYYEYLRADTEGGALDELACRISTNHTAFFREPEHFDYFRRTLLPAVEERLRGRAQDVRIWSAGCSSGEEPYTLAMHLLEHFGCRAAHWDLGILATDVSRDVLGVASLGIYRAERVASVPAVLRLRYLKPVGDETWRIKQRVRDLVTFRRLNLLRERLPFQGRFQAIFCRNVMIYFDEETRADLVGRLHDVLEPGGHLFVGHSESLGRTGHPFTLVAPAVYRKGPGWP